MPRLPRFFTPLLATIVVPLLAASIGVAQTGSSHSGAGSSMAGAHSFSAAPPTAFTSTPPTAMRAAPPTSAWSRSVNLPHVGGTFSGHNFRGDGTHHHPRRSGNSDLYYPYLYPYVYGVPVPYDDATDAENGGDDDDPEYHGGPTVFDRRGAGEATYVPPASGPPAHSLIAEADISRPGGHAADMASETPPASEADANVASEPPQPPTTLVFKDGHRLEVENYAIVGQTLFDLTPGHSRKITLSDLDLPATEKQNEDQGISFQLPLSGQGN